MATPPTTIYGKTDCVTYYRTSTGAAPGNAVMAGDYYTSLYKFLVYLSGSGVTELVSMNTGSGGNGVGYANEATRFGNGAFSVWKFKANATRDWDWYLYIHGMNGTNSFLSPSNVVPTRTAIGTTMSLSDETVMLGMQAAFSVSGVYSRNPWNGSISLSGTAYKGSPVWTSGSNNYTLGVLPRINNSSGSFDTNKEMMATVLHTRFFQNGGTAKANGRARYHYLFDGDGFLFAVDHTINNVALTGSYYTSYVGPFNLMTSIIQANSGSMDLLGGTGSLGFVMLGQPDWQENNMWNAPTQHTLYEYSTYGSRVPLTSTPEGGVFVTKTIGVRTCVLANNSVVHTTQYSPNPFANFAYDQIPFSVLSNETNFAGFVGLLSTSLIRSIVGTPTSHDVGSNGLRAVIAANNTAANRKITIPWSGSAPGTNLTREGITMSLPNYTL